MPPPFVSERAIIPDLTFRLVHGVPETFGVHLQEPIADRLFALAPLLTHESLKAGLAQLFNLVVRGELKVTVGGSYPLERVADAHRALEGRRTTGKLVLVPRITVDNVRFRPGALDALSTITLIAYADRPLKKTTDLIRCLAGLRFVENLPKGELAGLCCDGG